jgi:integrase/recombinase XerD
VSESRDLTAGTTATALTPRSSSLLSKDETKRLAPVLSAMPMDIGAKLEGWVALQGNKAYAANSMKALLSDWRHFARWAKASGRLPYITLTTPGDLVCYFDAHAGLAKATLKRRHVSIIKLFRVVGHPDNPATDETLSSHLKYLWREKRHGTSRGQAAALRWKDIERILGALDPENCTRDARARLALCLSYDGMLRRGELTRLRVEDLRPAGAGELGKGNASTFVKQSKTNQDGEPEALHCARLTAQWAREWIDRIGLGTGDCLICRLDEEGGRSLLRHKPIPESQISEMFKAAARKAGFAAEVVEKISGHSPRVGMTQDLVADGMSLVDIMFVGRWKSPDMVFRYAQALGTNYHATARLSEKQGRSDSAPRPRKLKGGLIDPNGNQSA